MKLITRYLEVLLIVESLIISGRGARSGKYLRNYNRGNDLIHKVLESLKRLIFFFERDYDSINLDGIYGLRLAEGEY